jgi:hypothetical protein
MPLKSLLLSSNQRLQEALTIDAKHVQTGDSGLYVSLIQQALMMIEGSQISERELNAELYGQTTTAAVLSYKRKYAIINKSYQTQADAVVGRMTIQKLDHDMLALEAPFRLLPGAAGALLGGMLFGSPKVSVRESKIVIVTETNPPFFSWANQVKKHFDAIPDTKGLVVVRKIENGLSPAHVVAKLRQAAFDAGPLGILCLSVGHGATGPDDGVGVLDMGPPGSFQLGGKGAWMIGDADLTPEQLKKIDPRHFPSRSHTSAYYADRPKESSGITSYSRLEYDRNSHSDAARKRISNWEHYQSICTSFFAPGTRDLVDLHSRRRGNFPQSIAAAMGDADRRLSP